MTLGTYMYTFLRIIFLRAYVLLLKSIFDKHVLHECSHNWMNLNESYEEIANGTHIKLLSATDIVVLKDVF